MGHRSVLIAALAGLIVYAAGERRVVIGQQPARDTSAQQQAAPPPSGEITGRIVAADTGRPIKRARAFLSAPELPEGRAALSDDNGVFDITGLPAGRYTLSVSKTGFVTLSYGQRRPLQAGTPLQLGDRQQMRGIDFRLPRGSVVAGHVYDDDSEPMPGAMVRVMRYQYLQGDRRLTVAGTAQTDDKGQYRVWGLMPGDYYVSAIARNAGGRGFGPGGFGGFIGRGGGPQDESDKAYAPTFFPGVGSVNEARVLSIGIGQEALDVDFNLQLVKTSRIAGRVTNPDGTATTNGNVNLTPEGSGGGRGQIGTNYGSRIEWDGAFSIVNVPPGRYMLRARSDDTGIVHYANQPLSVGEGDLSSVNVILAPGSTVTGTIAFDGGQPPDLTQVRIAAPATDGSLFGPTANARVDKDGNFTLEGIPPGPHWLRPNGGQRGWALISVLMDGRETVDTPIELRSGQTVTGVRVLFTNKLSTISGAITNEQGTPVTDYTVLAFPTDSSLWRPQARQIMTTRPDQNGQFQLRGLPPGEYFMATIDPTEQGEWFEPTFLDEHRRGAARITLSAGDVKTQNFQIRTQ